MIILKELIEACNPPSSDTESPMYNTMKDLSLEQQQKLSELLVDYFKLKSIKWIDMPTGLTDTDEPFSVQSFRITDSDKHPIYEGQVGYLYAVNLTPLIYDSSNYWDDYHNVDAVGLIRAIVRPTAVDYDSLVFHNEIRFKMNADIKQDLDVEAVQDADTVILSKMLHAALDKVLENPKAFFPKGQRYSIVRIAIKDDTIIKK